MKKIILIYVCSHFLFAQVTYESVNPDFDAHRINFIQNLNDSSEFGVSLFSSQLRWFGDDLKFSNHSAIIFGTFFIGFLTTEVHSGYAPYHLAPLFLICAPILLGNSQYTFPIDQSFRFKIGLRTDYFEVFNFNWKRISEFFISTQYQLGNLSIELKYNRTITNHFFHKYPNYIGIAIGYDISEYL